MFDDAAAGLLKEPLVSGADTVIDPRVAQIPGAGAGFTLVFSDRPLPGHQVVFECRREG